MTRDEAKAEFCALVARYGLHWTKQNAPDKAAWERLREVNKVLRTENDRREALGLPT